MLNYDLPCRDGHKSFYGKARIVEDGGTFTLISYTTEICTYDSVHHDLVKHNPVATNTTRRHIRSFLQHFGLNEYSNDQWDNLPLDTFIPQGVNA